MFGGFPSRLAGLLAVLALSPEKSCGFSLRTEPSPLSNRRRHGKTTHRRGREGRGAVFASPGEDAQFLSEGEMAKVWEPQRFEEAIYKWWEESGFFSPDGQTRRQETFFSPKKKTELKNKKPFVCPMPPPNVTGRLHMGHAMFVALEDIMCRFQRMTGAPTLWLPGTDHAGIATQMLVERQLVSEGTSRVALGRGAFLERVWEWKESYGGQIVLQMKRLGAGADWKRERFTLEQDLNQAVVEAFVRLYERGLIYKGSYLVNWSPSLQTAVSDLEVEYSEEKGTLFHFKYPVEGGGPEDFIPVATTRPEVGGGDSGKAIFGVGERRRCRE
uniref:valine--tRNA ligase n=1 Tax=Chromera velia CCMP2878 TaxID=1169474 RepID=A0A0G4HWP7_9ALVE|eukprot:Cvel_9092.t1-p1 / transcript=Cvel_9092.t1 / gene=Cvel_9092 / organism=Chromera_velia_CCMP2878 / gene_product=Valine--tRNA ligase, putative / transcript_product=Valine--tRNA ligase, putative / location=Cvel_scaffold516:25728-27879(-) / protein_length=328 / sequence_SO=supercontig / SO=protein_coding / is_pseudo=false